MRQVARHCRRYPEQAGLNRAVWLLLAASLALTSVGIGWGLPDQIAWAPDELTPMDVTDGVEKGDTGGWHLKYPPLKLYLLTVVYAPFFIGEWLGTVDLSGGPAYTALFYLARAMSVAMGVATIYVVYGLLSSRRHGSWRPKACSANAG